jgi:hypothetical protein
MAKVRISYTRQASKGDKVETRERTFRSEADVNRFARTAEAEGRPILSITYLTLSNEGEVIVERTAEHTHLDPISTPEEDDYGPPPAPRDEDDDTVPDDQPVGGDVEPTPTPEDEREAEQAAWYADEMIAEDVETPTPAPTYDVESETAAETMARVLLSRERRSQAEEATAPEAEWAAVEQAQEHTYVASEVITPDYPAPTPGDHTHPSPISSPAPEQAPAAPVKVGAPKRRLLAALLPGPATRTALAGMATVDPCWVGTHLYGTLKPEGRAACEARYGVSLLTLGLVAPAPDGGWELTEAGRALASA